MNNLEIQKLSPRQLKVLLTMVLKVVAGECTLADLRILITFIHTVE